jgi:hypothetical protein
MAASQSIFEWTEQVIVRRSQLRTIWRMLQHLKVHLVKAFSGVGGSV